MLELLNAALEPVAIAYTVLLGLVLIYWLSVIAGALDLGFLEMDADVDADSGGNWLAGALHFFNFGKLPSMVIISVAVLVAWCLAVLGNYYLGHQSWGFALAMVVPNIFAGLLVSKFATTPLIPLFDRLNKTEEDVDYAGMTCRILLPASASKFGQAEVIIDDVPLLILVKTERDDLALPKGAQALVVGKTKDDRYYLVRNIQHTNQ